MMQWVACVVATATYEGVTKTAWYAVRDAAASASRLAEAVGRLWPPGSPRLLRARVREALGSVLA